MLTYIIYTETLLISYERTMQIANLPPEKELRTAYDQQVGLAEEVRAAEEDRELHVQWPDSP
jgi:hypothetical protein